MKISPRRALSILLTAALLLGAVPPEASAQVVRVVSGPTGSMPVSPAVGPASGMTMAPALGIGAASLNGTLAAPSIAPSPLATPTAVSAAAPVAPVAAAPVAAAPALAVSVRAAASEDAPKLPNAPSAAAPVEKKTWTQRLSSLIGRKTAPAATPAAETVKVDADKLFDGAAETEASTEGKPVSAGDIKLTHANLKAALSAKLTAHKTLSAAKRAATVDEFGGPLTEPMTFRRRVGYGLKQGLNLVGLGAILEVTLRPLLDVFPWPQYMSDATLSGFGRVALLAKYGPNEIVEGLATSPATFLGLQIPMAVAMEEVAYRLLGFGLIFLVLAAVKPFTRWISSMIESLPDAAGVVGGAKRVLKAGEWLSHLAFPIAAVLSSFSFAAAHFATWGFSPFVLALNVILGLFLAHTAYRSRSLTSPVVAHLIFNLVTIGGVFLALAYSPFAGAAFAVIAGLLGASSLLHDWLTRRKERAFRMKHGAKALVAVMMLGGLLSVWNDPTQTRPNEAVSRAAIEQVQNKTEVAPAPAVAAAPAADAAAVESREAMVARVKGSVVNVIVRTPRGMGTGSGFILTPDGVFITNAHVVGSRRPGQLVEARIPGVQGVIKAKVLAVNHDKDLAIVQLAPRADGKPWPVVKLASSAPREGEDVTATGYPRGLPFTVSAGVVSGMDGRGNMYVKHLQTDAAINPGNSGGPLFNARGEVVGVNTQIYTQSGGSDGLGFSIMAPEVAHVMAQYAKTGNIGTASLGIIANLSDPMAPDAGLEIEYIRHGSAAEKAGLKRGDLIIGVGEATISEGGQEAAGHVAAVLSKMIPGQKTTITVLRGDEPVQLELTADMKVTKAPSH
ncbi:MAG: trypsin-like peptidase domain-containing protein [Elusimicrobia bacterium]|nr:trypsin-like peptidase domain-containing protein [Elusimicrobiota bacterium]